jgi:hypothetical protein
MINQAVLASQSRGGLRAIAFQQIEGAGALVG